MKKVTIIQIGGIAQTVKAEAYILQENVLCPHSKKYGFRYEAKISARKKREGFLLNTEVILLDGHGLDIKVDTDTDMFCGNACFNFIGEDEKVKEVLNEKAIFLLSDSIKGICTISNKQNCNGWIAKMLYPEIAEKIRYGHAPVNEILEKAKKQPN